MRMTATRIFILGLFAFTLIAQQRDIDVVKVTHRLALVVGNAAYPNSPLRNPLNDADDLSAALGRLGFRVTTKKDVTKRSFERALSEFTKQVSPGDLALVYFAGHGLQSNNENYLLPIDFKAETEADVPYEAFPASRLRARLEETGARVRVLILDACRNNPYSFSRSGSSGLAAMASSPEGTIIAFSAGDNQTADDNRLERNGLYTGHLLRLIEMPGLHLKEIFEKARADVWAASSRKQLPALYDMFVGRLVLREGDLQLGDRITLTVPPSEASLTVPVRRAGATRRGKDGLTYSWIPPGVTIEPCFGNKTDCIFADGHFRRLIEKGYWITTTEVTQAAYQRAIGKNPSKRKGPRLPVESLGWLEATTYCALVGLRLPTSTEWEHAARAGVSGEVYGNPEHIGWHARNSGNKTHEVGTKIPNDWGLYDMLGNVWEWTKSLTAIGAYEIRGFAFDVDPKYFRVWVSQTPPLEPSAAVGFRCAGNSIDD